MKKYLVSSSLVLALAGCSGLINNSQHLSSSNHDKSKASASVITTNKFQPDDALLNECLPYDKSDEFVESINIEIPKSRKWSKNLLKSYTSTANNIDPKFRKRFNAKLSFQNGVNNECKFTASIRVSGDWKDHISMIDGNPVASLDVKLETGNINGVVRFKLFLPETRGGNNEILVSAIFKELGLLSPRTRLINVNINGTKLPMIFQEKLAKEFTEDNQLRESALLKIDESLMWDMRSRQSGNFNALVFPAVANRNWVKKNSLNASISLDGLNILSHSIINSHGKSIHDDIPLSPEILLNGSANKDLGFHALLSILTYAHHGYWNHNRRFYYDPFKDSLIPVYYDGNSLLYNALQGNASFDSYLKHNAQRLHQISDIYANSFDFIYARSKIKSLDAESLAKHVTQSGLPLSLEQANDLKLLLLANLDKYTAVFSGNDPSLLPVAHGEDPKTLDLTTAGQRMADYEIRYANNLNNFYQCKILQKFVCEPIQISRSEQIKSILNRAKDRNRPLFYLNPNYNPQISKATNNLQESNVMKIAEDFTLSYTGSPLIEIDTIRKIINIEFLSKQDQIIIYDSVIKGWKIEATAPSQGTSYSNNLRYNSQLQTGSLVIQDSSLEDVDLSFTGGLLEDSINLVRSDGSISSISIKQSNQDALDIDFSDFVINSIDVQGAGNDCIDLSSGNYLIKDVKVSACADKAVSVGERSQVEVLKLMVDDSNIGVVAKDSSAIQVRDATLSNIGQCLALYRKKQEYSGSYAVFPVNSCGESGIYVQPNSLLSPS